MTDLYLYFIVALMPLAASMLVFQANPYHALIIRGILGAVSALIYAVLGAADVALTEALVGTMLSITLYAVAVRSSLILRLGILKDEAIETKGNIETKDNTNLTQASQFQFKQLMDDFRRILGKRHMKLELVPYPDLETMQQALLDKDIHATCVQPEQDDAHGGQNTALPGTEEPIYHTATRIRRIYDILKAELSSPAATLTYVDAPDTGKEY
jgi:putative multicomponent Na+:H+ antiporter subunit B